MDSSQSKTNFRSYLEQKGVIEALVNLLTTLYEESKWPIDPNEFIYKEYCKLLGIGEYDYFNNEINTRKKKIQNLELKVAKLKKELQARKAIEEDGGLITATNL